ncbi:formamidopyrimidine-DNA glycosylase [Chloroflexi bacterium TSY]|nr:formamidopyrimidine-DNA glycosylase [Chloroflexi bacterium TSY]
MPEYPDITVYVERLQHFIQDQPLQQIRIANPFLLRTAKPPIKSIEGLVVCDIKRIGKRIVFAFEDEYFLVLHLMISGRLQWQASSVKIPPKRGLGALDFPDGSLLITEASAKKRASLHLVLGLSALETFNRGGLNVLNASLTEFSRVMRSENHTVKRSLTDPTIIDGIGNAYSDEILHRAQLSPILWTTRMSDDQLARLYHAARDSLTEWTERLRAEVGDGWPKKVTAFRDEMAVHGKYDRPCPVCGTKVQRIRYASNETNYCPMCQTDGKLLADRALSRLLKKDWPRTMEELEVRVKR